MREAWTVGLVAALLATACGRAPQADPRRAERAAVVAYGAAAAEAENLQRAFLAAWTAHRECETVAALKSRGREHVLPALEAYIASLRTLSGLPPRLAELHAPLVAACEVFRGVLARYYERISDTNVEKRNVRLEAAWSRLGAQIVTYREAFVAYARELGLELGPVTTP